VFIITHIQAVFRPAEDFPAEIVLRYCDLTAVTSCVVDQFPNAQRTLTSISAEFVESALAVLSTVYCAEE
jgi:hypothetical protein